MGIRYVLSGVAALGLGLAGCGGASHSASAGGGGRVVNVNERDFQISAPTQIAAGNVTLRVHNHGPDEHELIVVRSSNGRLPLRSDGFTMDEDAVQRAEPGSLDPGHPGSVRDLTLHLAPGRYTLLCNMSGHYLGGMHHELVVT
jgi:uncharacterized cupredoxin-like copper-binding protein